MAQAQYTREQLIDGLNRAAAAGDNEAANEIAAMLDKMEEPTDPESMFPKFEEAARVTGERMAGLMPTPWTKNAWSAYNRCRDCGWRWAHD